MKRFPTGEKITTFREVFDWITYDWDYNYDLRKSKDSKSFYVNKLYIDSEYLTYKTECYELEEGLFEKVEQLYQILKENENGEEK